MATETPDQTIASVEQPVVTTTGNVASATPVQAKPTTTYVVNRTSGQLPIKLRNAQNQVDYMHLAPRRRLAIPAGFTLDNNWSVNNASKISVIKE